MTSVTQFHCKIIYNNSQFASCKLHETTLHDFKDETILQKVFHKAQLL